MRLNRASDFALRILMLLSNADEALSVETISKRLDLPKSHVMKIVSQLAAGGFVTTRRGRSGGVQINTENGDISVGEVVRAIESEFAVVDCLAKSSPRCSFEPRCALKSAMIKATDAFLGVLDSYRLSDIAARTQRPRTHKAA
ncbi:MAG: Rrf2 family transcriptional regulator [Alphaproteobacteria bacterium]|nr:Rrf2 family transcriptional regulator [Alphaproteobacteria bacterium]